MESNGLSGDFATRADGVRVRSWKSCKSGDWSVGMLSCDESWGRVEDSAGCCTRRCKEQSRAEKRRKLCGSSCLVQSQSGWREDERERESLRGAQPMENDPIGRLYEK